MKTIKVLGICGSLRRQSTNMNLLRYAREHAPAGMQIEIADLSAVPFYNADIAEKPAAIMGAGGGMGTSRAQYHLRQVCVFLDLHVLNKPEVFCNAFSDSFDQDGKLVDERIQELISTQLSAFQSWTNKICATKGSVA